MGLSPELEAACAPAMRFAFVMAAAWGFSALLRGFLAGARRTGSLALTGAGRLVVAALVGSLAFAAAGLDGALLGLAAWFAGYGADSGCTSPSGSAPGRPRRRVSGDRNRGRSAISYLFRLRSTAPDIALRARTPAPISDDL